MHAVRECVNQRVVVDAIFISRTSQNVFYIEYFPSIGWVNVNLVFIPNCEFFVEGVH